MTQPVLEFENVSKCFTFNRNTPQSVFASMTHVFKRNRREQEQLWAVKDVSFSVARGESVGLIGHNGSGKSTLLKLATRILYPTQGRVHMRGRVGALLELGAGFHNDLTGRENVYLNASILGLSKVEIESRFDQIVDFAELHEFINMPVKFYSSGMYMRLGFSVAVHCDPEILLVDEILAVGDSAFQSKCIDRIYQLRDRGTTIAMVSHHVQTLEKLCDRVVWMDHGVMQAEGKTDSVLASYAHSMNVRSANSKVLLTNANRAGSQEAEITAVRFLDQHNQEKLSFLTGEPMVIEMEYIAHQPITDPEMGFGIFREDGTHINGINNRWSGYEIQEINGTGVLRYEIEKLPLLPGNYEVSAAIQDGHKPYAYDFHTRAYQFMVEPGGTNQLHGVVELPAKWNWQPSQ